MLHKSMIISSWMAFFKCKVEKQEAWAQKGTQVSQKDPTWNLWGVFSRVLGALGGPWGSKLGPWGLLGRPWGPLGRPRAILGAKGGGHRRFGDALGVPFGHILALLGVKSSNAKMCKALRRELHFRGTGGRVLSSGVAFLGGCEVLRCMISCVFVQEPAEHEKLCLWGRGGGCFGHL